MSEDVASTFFEKMAYHELPFFRFVYIRFGSFDALFQRSGLPFNTYWRHRITKKRRNPQPSAFSCSIDGQSQSIDFEGATAMGAKGMSAPATSSSFVPDDLEFWGETIRWDDVTVPLHQVGRRRRATWAVLASA